MLGVFFCFLVELDVQKRGMAGMSGMVCGGRCVRMSGMVCGDRCVRMSGMVCGGRCVRKSGEACGGKVKSRTMSGWHVRLCVGRGAFVGNVRVGRSGVLSADSDFLALDGVDARL